MLHWPRLHLPKNNSHKLIRSNGDVNVTVINSKTKINGCNGSREDGNGVQTPTLMAYEPRLLCHMNRFYWGWGWSSIHWLVEPSPPPPFNTVTVVAATQHRGNESIYPHRSGPLLENGLARPKNRYGRYGFPSFYSISISTVGVDGARVCLWRFSFLALWVVVVVVDISQFPATYLVPSIGQLFPLWCHWCLGIKLRKQGFPRP